MIRALATAAAVGVGVGAVLFVIGNALFILGIGPGEYLIDRDPIHHL